MKKKINAGINLVALLAIAATMVLITAVFYGVFKRQIMDDLQLHDPERLGQIVVRPHVQTFHLVDLRRFGSDHYDRQQHGIPAASKLLYYSQPIPVRHLRTAVYAALRRWDRPCPAVE